MTRKTISKSRRFRIVPNSGAGDAGNWNKASRTAATTITKKLDNLRASRRYEKITVGDKSYVRVRDKDSKILSKFRISAAEKRSPVRKLRVKLAPGTVSPKKIFDAI